MQIKTRIVPCLWFDNQAEDAAKFYTSIFKGSKILKTSHYTEAGREVHGRPPGSVMTVEFDLAGQHFTALNGGPIFKFSEAISFQVMCDNQDEVDYFWSKLSSEGGEEGPCGWLKDKFGLSWQVVPTMMGELFSDKDPKKAGRAMQAMLKMKKLDIAELKRAAAGN
jgi:predicted 3-demethylubiquinone-9 3-methyltransferase (glyoxalase superfamily)